MRRPVALGTVMKVLDGPFAQFDATVVRDESGPTVEADVSMFGRVMRVTIRVEDLAGAELGGDVVAPVEPQFDLEPPIDFAAVFALPEVQQVPALAVRSGELVALDPTNLAMLDTDYAPFATRVPPGLYPVFAFVVRDRVKAVMVRFAKAAIARWRVATPFAADVARIAAQFNTDPVAPYRYECLGIGGLVDAEALRGADHASLAENVARTVAGKPFAGFELGESNLLAFNAHDGGPCPSWWGETTDGTVAALLCDLFRGDYRNMGFNK